jgi:adenine-specific DNA-methyltransferase
MAKKSAPSSKKPVATHKHAHTRTNIPTEELRDFVDPEEQQKKVLYPRDPSLDPQLVWRGKDEQDAAPLEVPAVPIYIQEKIHPQAIIEEFRRDVAEKGRDSAQVDPFADFNGLTEFANKVDFYHWEQHWSNRFILGDSLPERPTPSPISLASGIRADIVALVFLPAGN